MFEFIPFILSAFFAIFGGFFSIILIYIIIQSERSKAWPSVNGTVISAEVQRKVSKGSNRSTTYHPYVKYEYSVAGTLFQNDVFTFAASTTCRDPGPIEEILSAFQVGRQIPVFYCPSNPKKSVLVCGGSRGNWMLLIMGLVFMIIGIIGLS